MLIVGVICLICSYQTVMGSKTFMTNEISMPFVGRKEAAPMIMWNHDRNNLQPRYHSSRFERLKAAAAEIKPINVRPAEKQVEEPLLSTTESPLIQVDPARNSFGFTETPMETSPLPEPLSVTYAVPFEVRHIPTAEEETEETVEIVTIEPSSGIIRSDKIIGEDFQFQVEEVVPERYQATKSRLPSTTATPTTSTTTVTTTTTEVTTTTSPTTTPTTTTTTEPTTTTKRKLKLKKKNKKLRKLMKTTTTAPATEMEIAPEIVPIITSEVEAQTVVPVILIEPPTRPTTSSGKPLGGESYLGGWNEEVAEIVTVETTPQPSIGTVTSQISNIPQTLESTDDLAVQAYYKKYYEEWYRIHNAAASTEKVPITDPSASTTPRKINIQLGKKQNAQIISVESPASKFGISPSASEPTKEQLDKVCEYVGRISKSFGIKDTVTFAKNNCGLIKNFHPQATCEQVQHVMEYCTTGEYVHTQ